MKLQYKAVAKKDPRNPQGESKYYPSPVYRGTYSLKELSEYIANISTVSEIDTFGVLQGFVKVFPILLKQGLRLDLEGLGVFKLGFSTTASEKEEDVSAENIAGVKLKFTVDNSLKKEVADTPVEKA